MKKLLTVALIAGFTCNVESSWFWKPWSVSAAEGSEIRWVSYLDQLDQPVGNATPKALPKPKTQTVVFKAKAASTVEELENQEVYLKYQEELRKKEIDRAQAREAEEKKRNNANQWALSTEEKRKKRLQEKESAALVLYREKMQEVQEEYDAAWTGKCPVVKLKQGAWIPTINLGCANPSRKNFNDRANEIERLKKALEKDKEVVETSRNHAGEIARQEYEAGLNTAYAELNKPMTVGETLRGKKPVVTPRVAVVVPRDKDGKFLDPQIVQVHPESAGYAAPSVGSSWKQSWAKLKQNFNSMSSDYAGCTGI